MLKSQAAALCLIGKKVVLVQTRKKWSLPSGVVSSDDDSPQRRAEVVAWEQAGVLGVADSSRLGEFLFSEKGKIYKVEVFRLRKLKVRDQWPEVDSVKRELVSPVKAVELVDEFGLRDILRKLTR